jgi:hypothetical protein
VSISELPTCRPSGYTGRMADNEGRHRECCSRRCRGRRVVAPSIAPLYYQFVMNRLLAMDMDGGAPNVRERALEARAKLDSASWRARLQAGMVTERV